MRGAALSLFLLVAVVAAGLLPAAGLGGTTDVVPPETTITSGPADRARESRPSFGFSSSEPGSSFACSLDGGPFAPCESPYTTDPLENGTHSLRVRAIDPAGNADPTPAERVFDVDRVIEGANAGARPRQLQSRRPVELRITVRAGEPVRVRGTGRVRINKRRTFTLASPAVDLGAGASRRLELRPRNRSASRKILRTLRRKGTATATAGAAFTDGVGNRATLTEPVTLAHRRR